MEREIAGLIGNSKIGAAISLGRPWNAMLPALFLIIGSLFSGTSLHLSQLLVACASLVLVYMGGAAVNDIYDFKIDKLNMPYRPLQKENISIAEAKIIAGFYYTASMISSLMVSPAFFLAIFSILLISIIYSVPPFSFKNRSLKGNAVLSIGSVAIPLLSGAILSGRVPGATELGIFSLLTLSFFFINTSKDFKDVTGDKAFGKRTAVIAYGSAILLLVFAGDVLFLTTYILIYVLYVNSLLFLLASLVFVSLLFTQFYALYTHPNNQKTAEKAWGYERIAMLLLTVVLLISLLL